MPTLSVSHAKHLAKVVRGKINAFDIIKNTIHTYNFIIETQLGDAAFIRFKHLPIVFNLSVNNDFNSKNVTDAYIIDYLTKRFSEDIVNQILEVINVEMLADSVKKRSNNFLSFLKSGKFKDSYNVKKNFEIPENSKLYGLVSPSKHHYSNKILDTIANSNFKKINSNIFSVILKEESHAILEQAIIIQVTDNLNLTLKVFVEEDILKSNVKLTSQEISKLFLECICLDQPLFKSLLKSKLKLNASKMFAQNLNKFTHL